MVSAITMLAVAATAIRALTMETIITLRLLLAEEAFPAERPLRLPKSRMDVVCVGAKECGISAEDRVRGSDDAPAAATAGST